MGTYIYIEGSFTIEKNRIPDAMDALKNLNNHDDLKRGGGKSADGEREVWFSWCPQDYDQKVETLEDVFNMLGFEMYIESDDPQEITYSFDYSNKWGQHEIFFVALAPFCKELVVNHTCDELNYEDQKWTIALKPETGTVHQLVPAINIIYPPMTDENAVTIKSYAP